MKVLRALQWLFPHQKCIFNHLEPGHSLDVVSAFGGLALYSNPHNLPANAYKGADDDGFLLCEHVPFHEKIIDSGGRVLIDTRLINSGMDLRIKEIARKIVFASLLILILIALTNIFQG